MWVSISLRVKIIFYLCKIVSYWNFIAVHTVWYSMLEYASASLQLIHHLFSSFSVFVSDTFFLDGIPSKVRRRRREGNNILCKKWPPMRAARVSWKVKKVWLSSPKKKRKRDEQKDRQTEMDLHDFVKVVLQSFIVGLTNININETFLSGADKWKQNLMFRVPDVS